jgi:hypothetical protein
MIIFIGLIIAIIIAVCVYSYKNSVNEFQILQKEFDDDNDWSEILGEQLPLVIRNLPRSWLGSWNESVTGNKTWVVRVKNEEGRTFKTTWNEWLQMEPPRIQPHNIDEITRVSRLNTTVNNWYLDGFRRWSWLPNINVRPFVFSPYEMIGVRKVISEFTAIVSTDGVPIELWLAHNDAVPSSVSDELIGLNPWEQTSDDIPWIGEVKFIELKLRPGNAVIIPKHWWYAIRVAGKIEAWFWTADFNTPISFIASKIVS